MALTGDAHTNFCLNWNIIYQVRKTFVHLWLLLLYKICKRFSSLFAQTSLRELSDLLLAYAPQPSFDDMAWFALAYARVYETDKTLIDFFRVSKDIYHWIWINGWDETGTQIMVVAVLSHKHNFPYSENIYTYINIYYF